MSKTILMIHGFACGGDSFDALNASLSKQGWRCEAPTLFQHLRTIGAPPDELKHLSLADYMRAAEDYAHRLTDEDGEKPMVIGHGLGGLIAQKLAERHAVSGSVLITPFAPSDCGPAFRSGAATFANILLTPASERAQASVKPWRQGVAWGLLNGLEKDERDGVLDHMRFESGHLFNELEDLANEESGVGRIDAAKIDIPLLILAGVRDRLTPPRITRPIAQKFVNSPTPCRYLEFPEHGHWMLAGSGVASISGTITQWLKAPDRDLRLPKKLAR